MDYLRSSGWSQLLLWHLIERSWRWRTNTKKSIVLRLWWLIIIWVETIFRSWGKIIIKVNSFTKCLTLSLFSNINSVLAQVNLFWWYVFSSMKEKFYLFVSLFVWMFLKSPLQFLNKSIENSRVENLFNDNIFGNNWSSCK